jgi:4-oxalocrotonate tautomerase family enzyme
MPIVEINIAKGKDKNFLISLMDETINSIQETLKLPADDTNIRLTEYEKDFFRMKAPYKIIIEIKMFMGRSSEVKKQLFKTLVGNIQKKLSVDPSEVFILINENPKENWGIRGGIQASDIELNYNVEV